MNKQEFLEEAKKLEDDYIHRDFLDHLTAEEYTTLTEEDKENYIRIGDL